MMAFLWFVAGVTAGLVVGAAIWLDRASVQMKRDEHGSDRTR